MSLFTDNILPGEHGKIFGTDAKFDDDLKAIKEILLQIDGVKSVHIHHNKFPKEFTITSTKLVPLEKVEKEVKKSGFHLITNEVI